MFALPDSMAEVVGGEDEGEGEGGLGDVSVHWRLRFLMNGLGMRSWGGLGDAIGFMLVRSW